MLIAAGFLAGYGMDGFVIWKAVAYSSQRPLLEAQSGPFVRFVLYAGYEEYVLSVGSERFSRLNLCVLYRGRR
jgi:hypothetical protein